MRLIICLLLLANASPVLATTYYIDRADIDADFVGEATGCATPSDTDYDPATRQCGAGTEKVYSSLSAVDNLVVAGDTVFIRSGTYSTTSDIFYSLNSGTAANRIYVMRYPSDGNESVIHTGGASYYNVNFVLNEGDNYYTVQGIKFQSFDTGCNITFRLGGNYNEISGCTWYAVGYGIQIDNAAGTNGSYNQIYNNSGVSLGSKAAGLGSGAFVFVRGGRFNRIYNNAVSAVAHCAIEAEDYPNDAQQSRYNHITGNTIDQRRGGGGIYLNSMSSYNLISGNTITGVGGMPGLTQNKAGIMLSGTSNSTVRNNWIFGYGVSGNDEHRALMIKTSVDFTNRTAQGNFMHNNLVYGGYGLPFYLRESSAAHVLACAEYDVQNNTIANNIFYLTPTDKITSINYVGMFTPEAYYVYYLQQALGAGCVVWPSYAGNNEFSNNYIYTGAHGVGENDNYVGYLYGAGGHAAVIGTEEDNYPDDFNDGTHVTTATPGFVDSANYNFKLLSDSVLIDAGVQIIDTNGTAVEAIYPGYGWASLSFNGVKPDIGPAEYPGAAIPPSVPVEPDPSGALSGNRSMSLDPSLGVSTRIGN